MEVEGFLYYCVKAYLQCTQTLRYTPDYEINIFFSLSPCLSLIIFFNFIHSLLLNVYLLLSTHITQSCISEPTKS